MLIEKVKNQTSHWIPKIRTKQVSKYSNSPTFRLHLISPVLIQENDKTFNFLKKNNYEIDLDNRTKIETSKASLLKTQNWKQVVYTQRKENVFSDFSEQSLLQRSNYRKAKPTTNRPSTYLLKQAELKDTFIKLANQWRNETKHMSLISDIILHSAYQQIIGMGTDAVPLILEELSREPEHWFWALRSITGDNPIKPEDKGRLKKMAEAWLDWGRQHGYKC
ncbi:MAG: hypothetical protein PUP90_19345 [Nostoc sp. S4]|nr:hypothetical protein [Nostoc sp. S4]